MTQAYTFSDEPTPVDDVRRIRERLSREANGNMHALAERARAAADRYAKELNLKLVDPPAASPVESQKT